MKVNPKVFISYSWDSTVHKEWVHDFSEKLIRDGIDVTLDQWAVYPGDQLAQFMESAVRVNDFVIIVCTEKYRRKSDNREGGVGYEGDIMSSEILNYGNQRKFIPILRTGEWHSSAPSWLLGKAYIDMRGDPFLDESYDNLLMTLKNQRPQPTILGTRHTLDESESNLLELCIIVNLIKEWFVQMRNAWYTFGEARRILDFLYKLKTLLKSKMTLYINSVESPKMYKDFNELYDSVDRSLSEANYVLPYPSEEKYTRDTEKLKYHEYNLLKIVENILKEYVENNSKLCSAFYELKDDKKIPWNIVGYKNIDEFLEIIHPKTESLFKHQTLIIKTLIETIMEKKTFTEQEMLDEGFKREIFVETVNCLMRDNIVTYDDNIFSLNKVGYKILQNLFKSNNTQ